MCEAGKCSGVIYGILKHNDATFIAHARQDVADLIQDCDEQRQKVIALEFECKNYSKLLERIAKALGLDASSLTRASDMQGIVRMACEKIRAS